MANAICHSMVECFSQYIQHFTSAPLSQRSSLPLPLSPFVQQLEEEDLENATRLQVEFETIREDWEDAYHETSRKTCKQTTFLFSLFLGLGAAYFMPSLTWRVLGGAGGVGGAALIGDFMGKQSGTEAADRKMVNEFQNLFEKEVIWIEDKRSRVLEEMQVGDKVQLVALKNYFDKVLCDHREISSAIIKNKLPTIHQGKIL